jgi:hypothetical protein
LEFKDGKEHYRGGWRSCYNGFKQREPTHWSLKAIGSENWREWIAEQLK